MQVSGGRNIEIEPVFRIPWCVWHAARTLASPLIIGTPSFTPGGIGGSAGLMTRGNDDVSEETVNAGIFEKVLGDTGGLQRSQWPSRGYAQ